jgi:hypothetical protein
VSQLQNEEHLFMLKISTPPEKMSSTAQAKMMMRVTTTKTEI